MNQHAPVSSQPVAAKSGSSASASSAGDTQKGKRQSGSKTYKIQIQLSEMAKDRLFELVERTEAESAAQVVRDALRIYDILFDEVKENDQELIFRSKQTGDTELVRFF